MMLLDASERKKIPRPRVDWRAAGPGSALTRESQCVSAAAPASPSERTVRCPGALCALPIPCLHKNRPKVNKNINFYLVSSLLWLTNWAIKASLLAIWLAKSAEVDDESLTEDTDALLRASWDVNNSIWLRRAAFTSCERLHSASNRSLAALSKLSFLSDDRTSEWWAAWTAVNSFSNLCSFAMLSACCCTCWRSLKFSSRMASTSSGVLQTASEFDDLSFVFSCLSVVIPACSSFILEGEHSFFLDSSSAFAMSALALKNDSISNEL